MGSHKSAPFPLFSSRRSLSKVVNPLIHLSPGHHHSAVWWRGVTSLIGELSWRQRHAAAAAAAAVLLDNDCDCCCRCSFTPAIGYYCPPSAALLICGPCDLLVQWASLFNATLYLTTIRLCQVGLSLLQNDGYPATFICAQLHLAENAIIPAWAVYQSKDER